MLFLFSGIKCSKSLFYGLWERATGFYWWNYSVDTWVCCWGFFHAAIISFCIYSYTWKNSYSNELKMLTGNIFGPGLVYLVLGWTVWLWSMMVSHIVVLVFYNTSLWECMVFVVITGVCIVLYVAIGASHKRNFKINGWHHWL